MGFLVWWYDWGVWVGLLVALGIVFAILYDSRRKMLGNTVWLIVAIVGAALTLPSLLVVLFPNIAYNSPGVVSPFGVLGIVGFVGACVAGVGYLMNPSSGVAPGRYGGGYDNVHVRVTDVAVEQQPPLRTSQPPPQRLEPTRLVDERAPVNGWLVVRAGSRAGKQFGLSASSRNTIGRDGSRCQIPLDDAAVSAEHACIQWEHGQFVLTDLASRNGTFLNNQRIQRQSLFDDDQVKVGDTVMVFKYVR